MADPQPPASEQPPRRRKRRWLRRIVKWLAVSTLLVLLIAAGAGFWAWQNRTSLANRVLRQTFAAFHAEVENLDLSPAGMTVSGITVRDPASGAVIATVDRLGWAPEWTRLREGNLGMFRLEGAKLSATAEQLRAWNAATATATPTPQTPGGWRIPPLVVALTELRDVTVDVQGDAQSPSLSFKLNHTTSGLDLSNPDHPRLSRANLKIEDLVLTQPDGAETRIGLIETSARMRNEDQTIEIGKTSLRDASIHLTPWLQGWRAGKPGEATATAPKPSAPQTESHLPGWLKGIVAPEIEFTNTKVKADEGALGQALPLHGGFKLDYKVTGLEWRPGGALKLGAHALDLKDFALLPKDGKGGIRLAGLQAEARGSGSEWVINRLEPSGFQFDWNQELEDALIPSKPAAQTASDAKSPAAGKTSSAPAIVVEHLSLKDAKLSVRPTRMLPFFASGLASLEIDQIRATPHSVTSGESQKLSVRDVVLKFPGDDSTTDAFIDLAAGTLAITPDKWNESYRIDELTLAKPVVRLRPDTAPWMKPADAAAAQPAEIAPIEQAPSPAPSSAEPWWQKITAGNLSITDGTAEYFTAGKNHAEARARFSLGTQAAPDENKESPLFTVAITDAQGMIPDLAKLPVAGLSRVEAGVRLPQLWRDRRIESLRVSGGQIEVGDALASFFVGPEKAAPKSEKEPPVAEPIEKKSPDAPRWKVGDINVDGVGITLHKLAPGLPPVHFEVRLGAKDTPLEPDDLISHAEKQRVELTSLRIPSVHEPLRSVALLDTIFIEFSLQGLASSIIDKVEIVSPTLFVGEDLFWYIDYYRKFSAGEINSGDDVPRIAAVDKDAALAAASAAAEASKKNKNWTVQTLQVHAGKLVLAPKGVPLPGFHQPFPFSFVTTLDKGQFDATFDIPRDTYTLPDLKLEFRGMRGGVKFNMPIKGKSNNLTEVFRVDQIRWKQLHVEEGYLSVTYDMNGIYGQFGGAAYEGYVKGAFNVYLDQVYSWDGWITGTDVRTTEITEKLFPSYFLLDGTVAAKVIANGTSTDLYQADLGFSNVTPGRFSIKALDDMIQDYASEGNILTSQFTRIGLETLRDFDYEKVDGQGKFYGREGTGRLHFTSANGARTIDVNVYDHRWKDEPKKKPEQDEAVAAQP